MGVLSLRRSLRLALIATLLAAGSAQASSCISVIGFGDACGYPGDYPAEQIRPPVSSTEVLWPNPPVIAIDTPHHDRRNGVHGRDGAEHSWTGADATNFVHEWARRHRDDDFKEFRRHWHRDRDGHHGGGGCPDDDLPKPVPLPGAALLFGPALLMLRAFQRRRA